MPGCYAGGGLPELKGGGVSINGDIDGDEDPDITLRPAEGAQPEWGLWIGSSSANHVVCVTRIGNRITGARKSVWVRSNVDGATGNAARLGSC